MAASNAAEDEDSKRTSFSQRSVQGSEDGDPAKRERKRSKSVYVSSRRGTVVIEDRKSHNAQGFDDLRSRLRHLALATNAKKKKQLQHNLTLTRIDTNMAEVLSRELEEASLALQKKDEDLKFSFVVVFVPWWLCDVIDIRADAHSGLQST